MFVSKIDFVTSLGSRTGEINGYILFLALLFYLQRPMTRVVFNIPTHAWMYMYV